MDTTVSLSFTLDLVINSTDLEFFREAAKSFGGAVNELEKNTGSEPLIINRPDFEWGIIPRGKSGVEIVLPETLRGELMTFWGQVETLRQQGSAQKEAE